MAKTQATIMLKKKSRQPTDLHEFLDCIFYKRNAESMKNLAKQIINHIIYKNGLIDKERDSLLDSVNRNKEQYYEVLARMKTLGLIYKKSGVYRLAERFSLGLNHLSTYWQSIYLKSKEARPKPFKEEEQDPHDPDDVD